MSTRTSARSRPEEAEAMRRKWPKKIGKKGEKLPLEEGLRLDRFGGERERDSTSKVGRKGERRGDAGGRREREASCLASLQSTPAFSRSAGVCRHALNNPVFDCNPFLV